MHTYVKPTSDLFIRYLWGSEENTDILIDFVNTTLTDYHFSPAVSLTICNPFNLKELPDAKESILDVKAHDENGRVFDVEIQVIGNRPTPSGRCTTGPGRMRTNSKTVSSTIG